MDLSQEKLSKAEWQSIEIPVVEQEQKILKLIMAGFENPEIRISPNQSIATFMKMTMDKTMETFVFREFFQPILSSPSKTEQQKLSATSKSHKDLGRSSIAPQKAHKDLKKADKIRVENLKKNIEENRQHIFEFVLLDMIKGATTRHAVHKTVYSLIRILNETSTTGLNPHVMDYIQQWIEENKPAVSVMDIVLKATDYMERNRVLIQYADLSLFPHQKDLFRLFNQPTADPSLVLYIAPTGTGKTLSPLGLAQNGQRVIFVCSARHVGLGLAKSAISVEKKVAFAYGCQSAEDIRLHNFSAVDYVKNKRSGGIGKVDNSNGSRVEIMICDVKSYLIAMRYMLEFHPAQDIILYWDEPTITMDYEDHPLHSLIHQNWTENLIPRVVLSCATLPKRHEIQQTIDHFLLKFAHGDEYVDLSDTEKEDRFIHNIVSFDCKKTISILDPNSKCVLPHLLFSQSPQDLMNSAIHCLENKTLLRYFDLGEIVRFLEATVSPEEITGYFEGKIENVNLTSVKIFYLQTLLKKIEEYGSGEEGSEKWTGTLIYLKETQQGKWSQKTQEKPFHKSFSTTDGPQQSTNPTIMGGGQLQRTTSVAIPVATTATPPPNPFSGILFTTQDAYTLTDGPTIYITEDVQKMAAFYIQQTRIPEIELQGLFKKIQNNNLLQKRMAILENEMEDQLGKEALKEKKMEKENFSREVKQLKGQIELLRSQIEPMSLRPDYIPNHSAHTQKWATDKLCGGVPFTGNIEDADVVRIMELNVEDHMKILLLLGIGVFIQNAPVGYLEVIKTLATEQKLYLIIASSDYIYGTNYPFCHGILGKDLQKMTQQKTIQAMGRIGRNNIQQDYTVRFRNPDLLRNLFLPLEKNPEAVNMCRLFSG